MTRNTTLRIAEKFVGLPLEQRRLFLDKLRHEGKDFGLLPIPVSRHGVDAIPVSYAQQRLLFLWQLDPQSAAYNMAAGLRLIGELDEDRLQRAFDGLIARHEALRTVFQVDGEQPLQRVLEATPLALDRQDFSTCSDPEAELARQAETEVGRPFDLLSGPLLRASLFRLGDREQVLVVCMHHIVSDGWSMDVMVREFVHCYQAGVESLPPLPLQYADYAIWQRRWLEAGEGERQLGYWQTQLGDEHPLLEVAPDFTRPPAQSLRGETLHFDFGASLSRRLRDTARAEGVTLFMLMLAGYALFLSRHSGQRDIRIGVPNANRNREEVEGLIGFFVNTQVLRCILDECLTLRELLARVRETAFGAQAHQELPFEQLVEVLAPERSLGHNPLFQAKFNQNVGVQRQDALRLSGLDVREYPLRKDGTHFDLALDITDDGTLVLGEMTYASDLYRRDTVEGFVSALREIFECLLECPDAPLLTLTESSGIIPAAARLAPPLVLQRWQDQLAHAPEAIAACCDGRQLDRAALEAESNRLAHHLRELGVPLGEPVAVLMDRSLDWLVSLLACFKAGVAYMPLDTKAPRDRLFGMLHRSGTRLLLCAADDPRQAILVGDGWSVEPFDPMRWANRPASAPTLVSEPQAPAYVIHTSGSTGQPKGVVVNQGALASYVDGLLQRLDLVPEASMALVSTIAADLGHTMIFGALCNGHILHLLPEDLGFDPDRFAAYMTEQRIGVMKIVPGHLNGLLQAESPADVLPWHALIVGGEACPSALYRRVRELKPDCRFINHYGPSETTVGVLTHELAGEPSTGGDVPLGGPLPGAHIELLDDVLNPVPARAAGELYIGGDSVALGYLRQPALTAERFVPDPGAPGMRLYRSGDRARRDAESLLHFLGRSDDQVKIRGYRVEPGEVVRVLRQMDGILDAAVLALPQDDDPAHLQLVAWCVPDSQGVTVQVLREQLQARLPDYLVPAHLLLLERLPLTPNGKLDRRALPPPEIRHKHHVAPSNPVEEQLAAIWQAVLKLERVGVDDNFFDLGGDSILSLQIIARAKRQGIKLTPRQLFEKQTIAQLARVAKVEQRSAQLKPARGVVGETPLLPVQARFFERIPAQPAHYNQAVLLRPCEPLAAEVLRTALVNLVDWHDALRLRFCQQQGGWCADFAELLAGDLLWSRQVEGLVELEAIANQAQRSLDLEQGPLLRAVLFDLADGSQRLLLVIHHLAVDGVSWRVLLEDLEQICRCLASGRQPDPAEKGASVKAWATRLALWTLEPAREAELTCWQDSLAGAPDGLPFARTGADLQVCHARTLRCRLDTASTRVLLQEAPTAYRTQVNDLLLTALARALCRWTGQGSALVQLEGHGREDLFDDFDLSRTVGWFTSLFPVRLEPAEDLGASIKAVKERLRSIPRKGVGFGVMRYLGTPEQQAVLAALPQPRITFNYLGQFDQSFGEDALFAPAEECVGTTQAENTALGNWLVIGGQVLRGELELGWTFSREMFDEVSIAALVDAYSQEIAVLIKHCRDVANGGATPSDFPLAGLGQDKLDALPVPLREVEDIYPLSPMQEGMLFHTLYGQERGDYINQVRVDVDGLDVERFRSAWQATLDVHDILRTGFIWQGDLAQPIQVVHRRVNLPFVEHDWRGRPDLQRALDLFAEDERRQGFDLAQPPLLRLAVVRVAESRHRLIYTNHHILMDGWSSSRLLGEVLQRYAGRVVPAATGGYRDYIAWLQQQDHVAARAFWRVQLAELQEPTRLAQALRHELGEEQGHAEHHQMLDLVWTERLKAFAQRHKVTVNTLIQAVWSLLLQRCTGQGTVCFGATVAGRPVELPGIEERLGLFINTLPVIGSPRPEQSLAEWVGQVQARNLALREYEYTPLYEIQRWAGLGGESLFDSLLVFENYPVSEALLQGAPAGLGLGAIDSREQTNYPLTLTVELGETLAVRYSYDRRYFDSQIMGQLAGYFCNLLQALDGDGQVSVGELPMLDHEERRQILQEWNRTEACNLDECIHRLIEQQVTKTPEATALVFGDRELTYRDINRRANQLAYRLRESGVGPDILVGIAMERSPEMVVGLLAILKAGGAYVPLDLEYPRERLSYMLEDSQATLLLTQSGLLSHLPSGLAMEVLLVDRLVLDAYSSENPPCLTTSSNLAYSIYTSGSTGRPKGVLIEHRNVAALIGWSQTLYSQDDLQGVLASTSICFDLSVWELFVTLASGGHVVLAGNALELPLLVAKDRVRLVNTVPSAMRALCESAQLPASVRIVNLAGEPLAQSLVENLYDLGHVDHVHDLYGPSEDTTYSTHARRECGGSPSIGCPISNSATYLLDSTGGPVAIGHVGELCMAGAGLARGYLSRPALTAEKFLPDPFDTSEHGGGRLYRTGDLARYRSDGAIKYMGRIDHQVKVRGYRIELGEIEARLLEQNSVREAVVLAQEGPSGKQLVGYVVPTEPGQDDLGGALRIVLKASLPDYMVPTHLLLLDSLPLTPNGKLDRKALPQPDASQMQRDYVAPGTELEQRIASVWSDVLKVERVGLSDNFFELGGHSLLVTQVVVRVREQFGIDVTLRDLFEQPTLAEFSQAIERNTSGVEPLQDELAKSLEALKRLTTEEIDELTS